MVAAALGMLSGPVARAAGRPVDARSVAAQVQAFYDQTRNVQATFYQTYYHRLYGRYQRAAGTVAFEKPGHFRFDYGRPNGKVIASNGKRLVVYEPGDPGEPGQHVVRDATRAALPDAFGFLTGTTDLANDFRLRLLNAKAWGFDGYVLELRPKRPNPQYRRIVLLVESDPSLRGVVRTVRIDDPDGNRNKLELGHLRFNRPLNASRFAFVPPASSRPVQM